jgi:polyhydroxyalkanoate synthesis regulator phasin
MAKETFLQLITGANKLARKSKKTLEAASADYIEEHIIKGNYVSREEYENLQKLVLKLQKEVADLKNVKKKK